jgi:plastocyanin
MRRTNLWNLLLISLPILAAGCTGGISTTSEPGPPGTTQTVHIDQFAYQPRSITVPAGTKITWVNRDDVPHTVTSTARPKLFDSGTLDTDQSWSHDFDTPGTYEYFCAVHPKMTGQVIVK